MLSLPGPAAVSALRKLCCACSSPKTIQMPLVARTAKTDVPGRSTHFQCRAPAVQTSFCCDCLRAIVTALSGHFDIWKIGTNVVAIGNFDRSPNTDVHVRREVDRDVTRRSFKLGIVVFTARRDKLCYDAAGARCRSRRWHAV